MPLTPGTTLGPYQVTAKIGEGGMGEVYQARDTKLDRDVALKVLPDAFTADPDRLARFEREAKVLASLNHPNIGTIYGLEEAEGVKALVLELVEGPTLADRIKEGPIPIDEALPIAKQIAEALEAAHEQGVIHRDLKPANVKVRDDGTVKVLDFGLAKAFQPDASDPIMSKSPTISLTAAATQMGMVIGTAAYMAPEQAKGKAIDKRADLWAFGAVLYEMLAGARPFAGDDVSETLARVIDREPDWAALPDTVPPVLSTFLRRCLQKNPKKRIRDIGDVSLAMEGAFETTVTAPSKTVSASVMWRRLLPAALGMFILGALAAGFWALSRDTSPPGRLARFEIRTPPGAPLQLPASRNQPALAVSRDGSLVVYRTTEGAADSNPGGVLYGREVGQLEATLIRGTEGAQGPFLSPDGAWVAFNDARDSTLKRVSTLGGPPLTICPLDGFLRGASWATNGTIVFATANSGGLLQVPWVGGEPKPLTTVGPDREESHWWPEWLPGGDAVLFTAWTGTPEGSRIAVLSLETGEVTDVVPGGSFPRYAPSGHIVYAVDNTLRAVGFDPTEDSVIGNPVPVVEDVSMGPTGAANFDLAQDGSLVYLMGAGGATEAPRSLVWVDREGREEPLATPPLPYRVPRISPDGTRVAVDVLEPGAGDIWIHDLSRGTETRLTTDPAADHSPLWTPDGQRVVFASMREGSVELFQKLADAPEDAERLMSGGEGAAMLQPTSWSTEGQRLLFWEAGSRPPDIGLLSMEGDRARELLLDTEFGEAAPDISPDGDWIAYESSETGQREVYVQRFPTLGGKVPISTAGGRQPIWSADGSELFFRTLTGGVVRVPVLETENAFRPGAAEVLFETQYYVERSTRTYDVYPDGQRFLMITNAARNDDSSTVPQSQIILVQNWFDELQRSVPVP